MTVAPSRGAAPARASLPLLLVALLSLAVTLLSSRYLTLDPATYFPQPRGVYLATWTYTGQVARVGFTTLAVLWLLSSCLALAHIRQGRVAAHRAWMIRSFALTFAAVTLRLELPVLAALTDFETAYRAIAWVSWAPNLVLAEALICRAGTEKNRRIVQV